MSHVALKARLINGKRYEPGQVVDVSGLTEREIEGRVLAGVLSPATGATGEKGDPGPPGAPGPAGPRGEAGPRGHKGDPGAVGERGPEGLQGVPGEVGPVGPATFTPRGAWNDADSYAEGDVVTWGGSSYYSTATPSPVGVPPTGTTTNPGDDQAVNTGWAYLAVQGARGPLGEQGPVGPAGAQGLPGAPGERGPAGLQGPQGVPGTSSVTTAFAASVLHTTTRALGTEYTNGERRRRVTVAVKMTAPVSGTASASWRSTQAGIYQASVVLGSTTVGVLEQSIAFDVDPGGKYRVDGTAAAVTSWLETDS